MIDLRVSDVRQWVYCPRVVYWTAVSGGPRPVTHKMTFGAEAHNAVDLLERRRLLVRYGLEQASRRFHVRLYSSSLGLSGTVDMCLDTAKESSPVEFKDTLGGAQPNHLAQLGAYALLLEESTGRPVNRGFLVCIPRRKVKSVPLGAPLKARIREILNDIRVSIETEMPPAPTAQSGKCRDCEFLRFCGDRYR